MRLIDADAFMEAWNLNKATKYGNKDADQQRFSYGTMMMYEIADAIEDAPTVEPQEWISIKDRLPNEDCECWITLEYIKTGNRVLYESHYDAGLEKFYNQKSLERQGYKLIAWQKKRMPSPYKGE